MFYNNLESYEKDIDKFWKEFEDILGNFDQKRSDIKCLRKIQSNSEKAKQHYTSDTELLVFFLNHYSTDKSNKEIKKKIFSEDGDLSFKNG